MTELMLKEGLQSSDRDSQVREIARARTLLALQSIDAKRKGLLLRFLYDADLIKNPESLQTNTTEDQAGLLACIIRLEGADLGGVDLSGLDLKCINLIGVNLEGANFFAANLQDAMLAKAKLDNANLGGAAMVRAKLEGASLRHTYLHGAFFMFANAVNADFTEATAVSAKFHDADLRHTRFDGALLSGSDLRRTNLSSASLIEANLLEYEAKFPTPRNFGKEKTYSVIGPTAVVGFKVGPANIDESDLSHAILIRAKISPTQLSRAKSLSGTWMPDSTIHEEKPILVTEVVNTQTDTESGKRTESDAGRVGVAVDAGASIPGGEHRTHKADLDQPH
jgi:uncharacterized protein YjbI with pentapeptide repeats